VTGEGVRFREIRTRKKKNMANMVSVGIWIAGFKRGFIGEPQPEGSLFNPSQKQDFNLGYAGGERARGSFPQLQGATLILTEPLSRAIDELARCHLRGSGLSAVEQTIQEIISEVNDVRQGRIE